MGAKDKLRDLDMETLSRALTLRTRFNAGIFPLGSGQAGHFKRLARLGLLHFVGWGRDIDGDAPSDVAVYELTDLGIRTAKP